MLTFEAADFNMKNFTKTSTANNTSFYKGAKLVLKDLEELYI